MGKFDNKGKERLLGNVSKNVPAQKAKDFSDRMTFNLSFFDDKGKYGEKFDQWNLKDLINLLDEFQLYSGKSLEDWKSEKRGGGTAYTPYPTFFQKTTFKEPKGIPDGAKWGSIRLSTKARVIGFRMTGQNKSTYNLRGQKMYDDNIFYVVWLDKEHRALSRQNSGKNRR